MRLYKVYVDEAYLDSGMYALRKFGAFIETTFIQSGNWWFFAQIANEPGRTSRYIVVNHWNFRYFPLVGKRDILGLLFDSISSVTLSNLFTWEAAEWKLLYINGFHVIMNSSNGGELVKEDYNQLGFEISAVIVFMKHCDFKVSGDDFKLRL